MAKDAGKTDWPNVKKGGANKSPKFPQSGEKKSEKPTFTAEAMAQAAKEKKK